MVSPSKNAGPRGMTETIPVEVGTGKLSPIFSKRTQERSDTTKGFVCLNDQQPDKMCNDYRVRFSCPPSYCDEDACWTEWYDRDDPSGTGDDETLSYLHKENPGKICENPLAIEAQTLAGLSVADAGEVIHKRDTTTGFVCRNKDQPDDKKCSDYRVRFSCTPPYCATEECWTKWFDRDDPSATGDHETLPDLRKENPGKICPKPAGIQAQTLDGLSVARAGNVIKTKDTTSGFACVNADQPDGKKCSDYRVRFSCPESYCDKDACWTKWYDRDNPSGTGDWESLEDFHKENPGKICPKPLAIEAQTLAGLSVAEAGDVILRQDTTSGLICRNEDQPDGKTCSDYRVRFTCPPPYCDEDVCWTQWYDRDDPGGTGDWECLADFHKERPGEICEHPLYIEAVTTDTNTPSTSTGDIIFMSNPSKGFFCRNEDQECGGCLDYKVRFGCPC
ncbi:Cartilage intermediate layer protein 2 [Liparis tanakae]|uniref:Cartilage intermediate layer protein 2 n=1 Tax=Liparis tanakae TaxID=230148 RepID=A0A4Z2H2J7_9TELE|nr:Cartilage intermediate layer protein 2 [Liparis tanakae]